MYCQMHFVQFKLTVLLQRFSIVVYIKTNAPLRLFYIKIKYKEENRRINIYYIYLPTDRQIGLGIFRAQNTGFVGHRLFRTQKEAESSDIPSLISSCWHPSMCMGRR